MITAKQIRAARALLNWHREELSEKSQVSLISLHRIENEMTKAREKTLEKIQTVFEHEGIQFLPNDGLQMQDDIFNVHVFEGETTSMGSRISGTRPSAI